MLKLLALISARPDLSREQFIAYYEQHHVPLVRRLLPMVADYRRSYVRSGLVPAGDADVDFDVMTELLFEDEAALSEFWETITRPEVLAAIREDESHFLQSDKTRMIGAEQHEARR